MNSDEQATIQVAIVEDNPALAASFRKIIESTPDLECIGAWPDGESALVKIDAFRPQVVLMDINLPGMSGIEVTSKLKEKHPDILVVMVTVYRDHDQIFAALKAGASGYLLKRATPNEVRQAVRDVLTGGAPMTAEIARRIVDAFHNNPAKDLNEEIAKLSNRETEILVLLTEGLANKEIASRLEISVETVRVHLRRIYEKLHVGSRLEAAMKYRNAQNPPI